MSEPSKDPRDQRIAELEAQLAQAHELILHLQQQNAQLQQQNSELQQRLLELERSAKRQATPFARKKRQARHQKSGRRAGHGQFSHREVPEPAAVNATTETPLDSCPECGSHVTERRAHEQYEIDIPPIEPVITRFVTHSGYCLRCRKRVRSAAPEQTSTAAGAAGVVLGPRAKAVASDLKHRLGLSYEKTSDLLKTIFSLEVSRSGLYQADIKLAEKAEPIYLELIALVQRSATAHADETGWRIGVLAAWLWVFTNSEVTVYTISESRGHEVVLSILGREFKGVLHTDCFTAYDHEALREWIKQKCLAHLIKDARALEEQKSRGAVRFAREVRTVLRDALDLRDGKAALSERQFARRAQQIERRLSSLIDERRKLSDPDNKRLAKRLRKHREHLLRFLYVEGVEATNNRAERMLRPAVIVRKTGGCNRTEDGAQAHSILSSILATCKQQAIPIIDFLVKLQRFGDTPPSLVPS